MRTDRTPSPVPDRGFCRQRSPWTAPRERKRNRGAPDPCLPKLIESDASEGACCWLFRLQSSSCCETG